MSATTTQIERTPDPPPARVNPIRRLSEAWSRFLARIRPRWLTDEVVRGLRWGAVVVWLLLFGHECYVNGVPFDREGLLLWIATGAAAASIGRRSIASVVFDFVPFAAVLVTYDYLRGISDTLGMPTWWHPQVDIDKFLFFGNEPTVWLQERLKYADVRWYDVVVCLCYYSFFFLPYVMAGVMWLRSRKDFYRWSLRFVGLSFFGFALFALIPAAPPWAAARCSSAQIANHPNNPLCIYYGDPAKGGLLGPFNIAHPGANPWVERIAGRGFFELHLGVAHTLWTKGFAVADAVAAVPSLHLGGTMLFVLFMWSRLNKWWRPVLVAYPIVMTFSLVYSGEHYVSDCIAGAIAAVLVHTLANRIERWRLNGRGESGEHAPDTLESTERSPVPRVPESSQE